MHTHRISRLIVALVLVWLGWIAPVANAEFSMPLLQAKPTEHRYAKITVDGVVLNMLVDTAASVTLIDKQVAATLFKDKKLAPLDAGGGGTNVKIDIIPITSIASGENALTHTGDIKVIDMGPAFRGHKEPIHGVLGIDAFGTAVIEYSVRADKVTVYPEALPADHKVFEGATELNCEVLAGCFFIKEFVAYDHNGAPLCKPISALIDTGANISTMDPALWLGKSDGADVSSSGAYNASESPKSVSLAYPKMISFSTKKDPLKITTNGTPFVLEKVQYNIIGIDIISLGDLILDLRKKRALWRSK